MTTCVYQDGVLYTDTKMTVLPGADKMAAQCNAILADENHPFYNHMAITHRHRWSRPDWTVNIEDGKFLDCQGIDIRTSSGERVVAAAVAGMIGNVPFVEHFCEEGHTLDEALELALNKVAEVLGEDNRPALSMQAIAVTNEGVYYYALIGNYVYMESRYELNQTVVIGSGSAAIQGMSGKDIAEQGMDAYAIRDKFSIVGHVGDIQSFYDKVAKNDPMTNNNVKYIVC